MILCSSSGLHKYRLLGEELELLERGFLVEVREHPAGEVGHDLVAVEGEALGAQVQHDGLKKEMDCLVIQYFKHVI